ncbi:MAG: hypothetical protein Q8Q49_02985, partial [bacterium]|nr:hypothetical protein [bacterium]
MKKRSVLLEISAELIFFAIILAFSIKPVFNFDFWFHIKYGEYILATRSLPFTDVFSHTTFGQPAIPYEWLFQVLMYLLYHAFGTVGIQTLVLLLLLSYLLLFRQILKEIFRISLLPRLFLIATVCLLGFDFWVERPQSGAYVLFMAVLYLVLKRVFKKKNVLVFTLPIFIIWTNMHASIVLGLYLFAAFALLSMLRYVKRHERDDLRLAKEFTLYGLINFVITLLPPLSYKVYQLLWLFFEKRTFITSTIDEWVPLTELSTRFYIYLVIIILCLFALFLAWRKKPSAGLIWFLPFLPLGLFVLSGVRQTAFTMPVILILAIPFLRSSKYSLPQIFRYVVFLLMLIASIYFLHLYQQVLSSIKRPYPVRAIPFIKENIRGNMFNELFLGGYLLYQLGPEYKTFIDGRTDMFLPIVFPEYTKLDTFPNDNDFYGYFRKLVKKYHVSWAII